MQEELTSMLEEQIEFGENLILQLVAIEHINGVVKLTRKIGQEIEFLKKLQRTGKIKKEQLLCSNLRHLGALTKCALRDDVVAVFKNFPMNDNNKLIIDIISNEEKVWTKVIARNPKSLSAHSSGMASFGARSILDQANDYLECAKLYPCMYQPPKVVFEFASGIEESLANKLKAAGIIIRGDILPNSHYLEDDTDDSDISDNDMCNNRNQTNSDEFLKCEEENSLNSDVADNSHMTLINLDVTAMMAYVSNMTNGYCDYEFQQGVLTQQAAWERERPVKPILDKLFEGKVLICCNTAWEGFESIVNILGGPMEKQRTAELKNRVKVYPDNFAGDNDLRRDSLKVKGHVRLRSKIIFNFGHRAKALTVSANEGFMRAAFQQGVHYTAFIHESRALTEGKEETAKKIF